METHNFLHMRQKNRGLSGQVHVPSAVCATSKIFYMIFPTSKVFMVLDFSSEMRAFFTTSQRCSSYLF